ncbi:MAG TPA: GH3 auxin-responsive promoter family protein, partial [Anseongella sp.]
MGIKPALSKVYAAIIAKKIRKWDTDGVSLQHAVFHKLLESARNTSFGKDHGFATISNYKEFRERVPVRDYEALRPYIERMVAGEPDVLWKGKPQYLAKTSGTTSGVKYIPITHTSMPHHIKAARNALLLYIHETGKSDFVNGKMIFLQGSPVMTGKNGMKVGRLSG